MWRGGGWVLKTRVPLRASVSPTATIIGAGARWVNDPFTAAIDGQGDTGGHARGRRREDYGVGAVST